MLQVIQSVLTAIQYENYRYRLSCTIVCVLASATPPQTHPFPPALVYRAGVQPMLNVQSRGPRAPGLDVDKTRKPGGQKYSPGLDSLVYRFFTVIK